ncbi:MAG: malectin domain-containing carbohydrate-binding protein [Phormidesmis sp.]
MVISFNSIGSFNGVVDLLSNNPQALDNPTSLEFGPDGRLYVAQQNQPIVAFTIAFQNGQYVATAQETLRLPNGDAVVQSIQNHNDDGTLNFRGDRQTTGLIVTGTAENPVLYVTSSDPRLATATDQNLDTNSSVVTRVSWTGSAWEAVDLVRGLPRSEEAHSINGLALSPDGTKLYVAVGGNTNNGAPSSFFGYAGEYALSGTIIEIDLIDIDSRPILTDNAPGQNGRQYVYDLPTLDDPTIENVTDGIGEDDFGRDEAGPWGGNDGLNMAILPADAPLRIYADGFRNHYDLVMTADGKLYTVDNGSNADVGGAITYVEGKATSIPSNGGTGDSEPLFLVEDGGYYGHPNPARSNQTLEWTVYDDTGNPDPTISPNSTDNLEGVQGLADLVPEGVAIAEGFLIDPSKFTDDATRLAQSGVRVPRNSAASNAIANNLGSSSNGLVQYTGNAFDGALNGKLITAQFNGNITLLNLNTAGNGLEPVIDPDDGTTLDADGVFPLVSAQTLPLDVTVGPNGTLWIAEFGPDNINVFAPSDSPLIIDPDIDDDGIDNRIDPFIRDASNGGSAILLPGSTLLWDFDPDQDNNLPGPDGYATGLTGVAINGTTDFEAFLQSPADNPGQLTKLDNVKFATASGGGSTLIEFVSGGNALESNNSGEYLFHTGVTIAPTVETFTVTWTAINPTAQMSDPSQQIGGYIGTGDQSNYLKVIVTPNAEGEASAGEIQVLLEDNDLVQDVFSIPANAIFAVPDPSTKKIFFELEIDPTEATATPTVRYETGDSIEQVNGRAINLAGTAIFDAIQREYTVQGQRSGLAVGLFSTNGEAAAPLSAIFDGIELSATGTRTATAIYRINAGGPTLAAIDGGIDWISDTTTPYLTDPGSDTTVLTPNVSAGETIPVTTPNALFNTERYDDRGGSNLQWAFAVDSPGLYEVRLFAGNAYSGASEAGQRIFDVVVEGTMPTQFTNIDLSAQFGHTIGGMLSSTVEVTDGILNLEFL